MYNPTTPALANPPKTPWGHPDLRGYYVTATYTPLQRPQGVDKPLYTADEAIAAFQKQVDTDASADPAVVHYDWKEFGMEAWQSPVRPNMRSALITDPQNGRLPALTPEAQQRRADAAALARKRDHQTGVEIFQNMYTRCILGLGALPLVRGGQPGSTEATSAGVSTEIQIFQTPDHVVIVHQSNSDVRIIPLNGRPHIPGSVRQYVRRLSCSMGRQYAGGRDHQSESKGRCELPGRQCRGAGRRTHQRGRREYPSLRVHHYRSEHLDELRGRARRRCRGSRPHCTSSPVMNRTTG